MFIHSMQKEAIGQSGLDKSMIKHVSQWFATAPGFASKAALRNPGCKNQPQVHTGNF